MINYEYPDLLDKAYMIATGNHLVESFTFDEFQEIDVMDYIWEPLQYWDTSTVEDHITQIADEIYRALEQERNSA